MPPSLTTSLLQFFAHELGHFITDHERETLHQYRLVRRQSYAWLPVVLPGALMVTIGGSFRGSVFALTRCSHRLVCQRFPLLSI